MQDLKPENLFITSDGRVKILDFGLAKLTHREPGADEKTATEHGVVLGTMGYMSPEQARGLPADHRADIFSLGAVLFEMLAGRRAFRGESALETMNAIVKDDPLETHSGIPAPLDRIVRHCLEKNPAERFQSARDLAFDLASLTEASATAVGAAPARTGRGRHLRVLLVAAAAALVAVAFWTGTRFGGGAASNPSFRQITFGRGGMLRARFAPDGQTILYAAAWEGAPLRVYSTSPESTESRDLGLPNGDILAVSRSGELAISLGRNFAQWWPGEGTLARAPLAAEPLGRSWSGCRRPTGPRTARPWR